MTPSTPPNDVPSGLEQIGLGPAPVTYRVSEGIEVPLMSATEYARILAALFEAMHVCAQAEIDLAFCRLAPPRYPRGL